MTDTRVLRATIDKAKRQNYQKVVMRITLAEQLLDALDIAEKKLAEQPGQKHLIGWRMADYTDETADPKLAKNWATAVDVLPIFEGDVNTKLNPHIIEKDKQNDN